MLGRSSHRPSVCLMAQVLFWWIENKIACCWIGLTALKTLYLYFCKDIKKISKKLKRFLQKILKSSFLPKYDFINSFWNLQDNTFFLVCSTKKSWQYSSYKELYNTIAPGLKWFIQTSNVSHGIPKIDLTAQNTLTTGQSQFVVLDKKV